MRPLARAGWHEQTMRGGNAMQQFARCEVSAIRLGAAAVMTLILAGCTR